MKRPPQKPAAHDSEEDGSYKSHPEERSGWVIRSGGIADPSLESVIRLPPKPFDPPGHSDLMWTVQKGPEGGQYAQEHRYKHSDEYIPTAGPRPLGQFKTLKLVRHYITVMRAVEKPEKCEYW